MVDSVGSSGGMSGVTRVAPVTGPVTVRTSETARAAAANAVPNPAADLAAWGPTVDEAKVEALREAIADGSYRADPARIAAKMVETDLPAPKPAAKPAPKAQT